MLRHLRSTVLFLALLCIASAQQQNSIYPLVIAHRGASGYVTGNTLEAFQRAIELGSQMIELDVQVCKSGEIIVYHDQILSNDEFVRDHNLTYIRELENSESKSVVVAPTIEQVLELINGQVDIYFDLKDDIVLKPLLKLLELTTASRDNNWKLGGGQFHLGAFNHNQLLVAHEELSRSSVLQKVELIAIMSALPIGYARNFDLRLDEEKGDGLINAISIEASVVTRSFVTDAHRRGIKVYVWTANAPKQVAIMKDLDVDGIVSDYPDRLL